MIPIPIIPFHELLGERYHFIISFILSPETHLFANVNYFHLILFSFVSLLLPFIFHFVSCLFREFRSILWFSFTDFFFFWKVLNSDKFFFRKIMRFFCVRLCVVCKFRRFRFLICFTVLFWQDCNRTRFCFR